MWLAYVFIGAGGAMIGWAAGPIATRPIRFMVAMAGVIILIIVSICKI